VKSIYFLVLSRVRLDRAALDAQSLIVRQPGNRMATTLLSIREH
jgi:general secretion pathway protein K